MRIAWFSPVPPARSGIAAYTAEIVPLLQERLLSIDLFIDPTGVGAPFPPHSPEHQITRAPQHLSTPAPEYSAHEFVWRNRRRPYDLTVYQLGNAECHNYMWAYLFRYPGLVVLHDAQLHQSRALWLLKRLEPRREDYFAELHANHPDAPADLGELVAAGLGGSLYQLWPMLALVRRASRLTAVHNARLARALRETASRAGANEEATSPVAVIPMGVRDPATPVPASAFATATADKPDSRLPTPDSRLPTPDSRLPTPDSRLPTPDSVTVRSRLGIPSGAVVVAAYGGITPEKRIPQLLRAVAALGDRTPPLHVMLVGGRVDHYDVDADARALGIERRVHVAGYVPDEELGAYLLGADIACCLRWPTNRETSASWLRCLAAGKPTLITRLWQLDDVPARVATSIDVLDEDTALPAALARLAADAGLRAAIGERARAWWVARHQLPAMAAAYERVMAEAAARPIPRPLLPAHLADDTSAAASALLAPLGVSLEQAGLKIEAP